MHSGPTKGTLWTSRVAKGALGKALASTSPRRGGWYRRCRGSSPPFWTPKSSLLGALFASLAVSKIGTASKASFGSNPLHLRTVRGAPEQVKYRLNLMSTISLRSRSGNAPGPFWESKMPPPGALFQPPERL